MSRENVGPLSWEVLKNNLNTVVLDMGKFIHTRLCGIFSPYSHISVICIGLRHISSGTKMQLIEDKMKKVDEKLFCTDCF